MHHEINLPWLILLGLGAFHGINPAMGWLFAVALGLQERRRNGVLAALLPLGVGHALAVAAALAIALVVGAVVPLAYLRWIVAAILIPLGIIRLFRHRHPRWASMRVGMSRLTLWSFLMASAHGAGLMVVPVFLGMSAPSAQVQHQHMENMVPVETPSVLPVAVQADVDSPSPPVSFNHTPGLAVALRATGLHAIGYLLVTALIALFVYEKFGLAFLRKAWFNLDLLWAVALIATGLFGLMI